MKACYIKRLLVFVGVITLAMIFAITISSFVYSANLGYLVGNVFAEVDIPTDEVYLNSFTAGGIDWEIAYWCATISEYTYAKESYPPANLALETLGFATGRFHSYFQLNEGLEDDLMVDIGVKEVKAHNGSTTQIIVVAFRGSVPRALNDPTTSENMRRSMDYASVPWREIDATVHRGFRSQYSDFLDSVLEDVNATMTLNILRHNGENTQDVRFWVTGHSLGGALAELFTLDLVESGVNPEHVLTYGYATPLIGSKQLQEYAQSIGADERIFKIVHRQDMIGYIGYGVLSGMSLADSKNITRFGAKGLFDRSHHSLPRVYLPYIASQNAQGKREQFLSSLIVSDMQT